MAWPYPGGNWLTVSRYAVAVGNLYHDMGGGRVRFISDDSFSVPIVLGPVACCYWSVGIVGSNRLTDIFQPHKSWYKGNHAEFVVGAIHTRRTLDCRRYSGASIHYGRRIYLGHSSLSTLRLCG